MKKWFLFLFIIVLLTSVNCLKIQANSNYQAFESIDLKTGKFLKDYTTSEYKKYYKKVEKRKFSGWRTHEVTSHAKVTYKTETIFSYFNDGTTSIDYNYEVKRKNTTNINLSATGNIGIKLDATISKFKGGLDRSLKVTASYSSKTELQENFKMTLKIDPGTMLNLYITGEGHISNGVAANYLFWLRTKKGGYEVFVVTTQYYRLEKVRI